AREGLRVIDLGCGTGELTRRLADYLPASEVVGVDSSAEMLERAESLARPGLKFEKLAIEEVAGEWDLVFSHAAIQWVENHAELVPRLFSLVAEGGQLVVQLPSNHSHPTHTIIIEIASEEPFRSALGGWTRKPPVLSIGEYSELLYEHDGRDLIVFEKIYPHVLENAEALAEWTAGTALVPYFERLPEELREPFLQKYRARLRERWPRSPVFYPFQRILFSATRVHDQSDASS
ncbi:MAG TPA: methyltransferase domain-containing protein, partial [Pyrinomonadaceae bacterium]